MITPYDNPPTDKFFVPLDAVYTCPVCGDELSGGDTIFKNYDGEIVGCRYCVSETTAERRLEPKDEDEK